MAGAPGFEPGNAGIKTLCLTAWRCPNNAGIQEARILLFLPHFVNNNALIGGETSVLD
jgi:hypothetical protein